MQLSYLDLPDYQFPHWIDFTTTPGSDDLAKIMDINQWCGDQFGDLGQVWGYDRQRIVADHPEGLNRVRVTMHYTTIHYSWRFKNKSDAMAFKLAWGGA